MPELARTLDSASASGNQQYLIGFDPGRDKCGLAVALVTESPTTGSAGGGSEDIGSGDIGTGKVCSPSLLEICHCEIVRSDEVETRLEAQYDAFHLAADVPLDFVMGNQTTARRWQQRLLKAFPQLNIHLVDERFSSQEARQRYWSIYPARGLQRLVPLGMREPPRPIDDIVAQILIERYLEQEGFH